MAEINPNSVFAGIMGKRGSNVYNSVYTYEFLNKDYTYILELHNGDKSVIFEPSQELVEGFKNRKRRSQKYPNDPTLYSFVYVSISKLDFIKAYESLDKFKEDFSEIDKIIFKIRDNSENATETVVFESDEKYYLTSYTEDITNDHTLISEVIDRLTVSDIENIDNMEPIDDSVHMYGSLVYVYALVKYLKNPELSAEENLDYIKNNYKEYLISYVFGYNTRIKHDEEKE